MSRQPAAAERAPAAAPVVEETWRKVTPALAAELVAFWGRHQALASSEEGERRARQAVLVARDAAGVVCGVSTAVLRVLPRLRQPMYYYRQFFAPPLRGQALAAGFFARAKAVLQAWNAGLPQPEGLGLLLEIENRQLAAAKFGGVFEPLTCSTFIGYSPRGLQLRVSYFEDARLLPQAVQARPARRAH